MYVAYSARLLLLLERSYLFAVKESFPDLLATLRYLGRR